MNVIEGVNAVEDESSDDYESTEDSPYRPPVEASEGSTDGELHTKKGKARLRKMTKNDKARFRKITKKKRAGQNDIEMSSDEEYDFEGNVGTGVGHKQHYFEEVAGHKTNEVESDNDSWVSEELKSPISTDDEQDGGKVVFPQFNEATGFGQISLEVGMEFSNLSSFKSAVREYTIYWGRELKWVKNDKIRARAKCKHQGCQWEIFCVWSKVTKSFQIKTFLSQHTCSRGFKNKQANRKWVVKKLEDKIRSQPSLSHHEAFEYLKREFGVHVDDSKIFRSMKEARELVEGSERLQYGRVWDYAHELMRSNPGSNVKIDVIPIPESPPQFQRFYVCLEGCKSGFKAGCRPFIGLDGCFLKGYFGGQLLAAVGQDANNHIFVIAYAIVDIENKDNWKWFLTLLHEDLGDYKQNGWNFMSDMQKGLIPAIQEVMPGVPHRFCVMHLWRNFTKQWKDKELKGLVWECAKSTTVPQFNRNMERVKMKNEKAWQYLAKWPKESWSKAHFSAWPKVDNICNNTCEVFNAKILKYRGKPILTMAEEIRCYIMRTMSSNKLKLATRSGPLAPMQQSRLDKEKIGSNQWTPYWSGDPDGYRFEVHSGQDKVDVNLEVHSCTCRFWQLTGMPCLHACAAIAFKNQRAEDYCHGWLTMGSYNATYQFFIQPTHGQAFWENTQYEQPVPPPVRRRAGRPKKHRRKDENEGSVSNNRLKRSYPEITCSRCGLVGHNMKGCHNQGVPLCPKNWTPPEPPPQEDTQVELDLSQSAPYSQPVHSQPTYAGLIYMSGYANIAAATVRPPPIRGVIQPPPFQRVIQPPPIRAPFPLQPADATGSTSIQPRFMEFITTPRGPTPQGL